VCPIARDCSIHAPFSISTGFMKATMRAVDTREECHWSHACSLQANMQWDPMGSSSAKPSRKTRTLPLESQLANSTARQYPALFERGDSLQLPVRVGWLRSKHPQAH
jgi:hypothetical protein